MKWYPCLSANNHLAACSARGRIAGRFAGLMLAAACLVVALADPVLAGPGGGVQMSPVSVLSTGCEGPNAEVVSAVGPPDYVYEAWIGCGGEGFARSTDGGLRFSQPITLPDSSGSDDPALAVATDGTVYVSYLRYHDGFAYPVVAYLVRSRGNVPAGRLAEPRGAG
jgi:hypothetical protein